MNNEITNQNDFDKNFRINLIIFYALLSAQLLFLIIILILVYQSNSTASELDKSLIVIIPLFGLLMMYLSRMIYRQSISKFDSNKSLFEKLNFYRTFKIISWAQVEAASLFSLIAFLLTSNYLYIYVFVFLIGYFIMLRPSKETFIKDMRLTDNEINIVLKRA